MVAALVLLVLSLLSSSHSSARAAALTAGSAPASPVQAGYTYTIRSGDTLWDIAVAHGISLEALLEANNFADPAALSVGQTIRIPADPPAPTPHPTLPPAIPPTTLSESEVAAPADPVAPAPEPAAPTAEPPPAPDAAPEQPVIAIAPELADWRAAVLTAINARRAEKGLPALIWSEQLGQAAQAHADDCARRNRGSHVGADGARLRQRLARAGYEPGYASENWANARNADHAVRMWWNEPASGPHRLNILGPNYTEIGIGVARASWGYYFVVDFASR
jgi:uncharacterized protein YkwD